MFPLPTFFLKSLLLNNNKNSPFPTIYQIFQFIFSAYCYFSGFHEEERERETVKALSAVLWAALCPARQPPELQRNGEEALLGDIEEYLHKGATGMSALCRRGDHLESVPPQTFWSEKNLPPLGVLLPLQAPWQGEVLCCCMSQLCYLLTKPPHMVPQIPKAWHVCILHYVN